MGNILFLCITSTSEKNLKQFIAEEERGERDLIFRETIEIEKNNDLNFLAAKTKRKTQQFIKGGKSIHVFQRKQITYQKPRERSDMISGKGQENM